MFLKKHFMKSDWALTFGWISPKPSSALFLYSGKSSDFTNWSWKSPRLDRGCDGCIIHSSGLNAEAFEEYFTEAKGQSLFDLVLELVTVC